MEKLTKTNVLLDDDIVDYLKSQKSTILESYSTVLRRLLKLKIPK